MSKSVASLLKRVYFKRKEFASHGSKFFPFNVDPCSDGALCVGNYQSCLPCKMAEIIPVLTWDLRLFHLTLNFL